MSHDELLTKIRELATQADWRYFEFYLGWVRTMGSETAGEKLRRWAAADESAAATTREDADRMRDTYMNLVLPHLTDGTDLDKGRAVLSIYEALKFCPAA